MFGYLQQRKRAQWRQKPVPESWAAILAAHMPLYRRLPKTYHAKWQGDMQVFLAEKYFEGCGGLELTEAMKVTVAAHACFLLLGHEADYYPGLRSILIYPSAFYVNREEEDELGFVAVVEEYEEGESWDLGTVILSWEDILQDTRELDGRNVLLHEFAHQWEDQGGLGRLAPETYSAWGATLQAHFEAHQQRVDRGRPTFLDAYGAEALHEFFAVATEAFFERPEAFRQKHEELYDALRQAYGVNPATW